MREQRVKRWRKLDNAAKIFPPNCHGADTKVFRFTCQLTEPVCPEILQKALDLTLPEFPAFTNVMRKGLFWYYLEESYEKILVQPEQLPLCAPLYRDSRSALLRVVYYDRRFSFEMFHVLADGTGAMQFFRVLVCRYLSLAHSDELGGRMILPEYDASVGQRMDDSFARYYDKSALRKRRSKPVKAARLRMERSLDHRISILEGRLPLQPLKQAARQYHTTITIFLSAVLIRALAQQMPVAELRRPVVLSIPVDLRNFFPSATCRNFFSVFEAGCQVTAQTPLEDIIPKLQQEFERRLQREHFAARLARLAALERNLLMRVIPLPLKDFSLYWAYRRSEQHYSAAFSNVGRIQLPQELLPYIQQAGACNATGRLLLIASTLQDTVCLAFTSAYLSTEVQRRFFTQLTDMGIPVTLTGNTEQGERIE
ncbi:MAG: hypothetical protein MSH10_03300 [Pygmaiobacter massiliensis]|nr:hypothetical protein [Pygmaiobacter massiliensis]